jgi:transposase
MRPTGLKRRPVPSRRRRKLTPGRFAPPHADFIRQELAMGLSGRRIFQDLQDDFAFSGSYASVKRYLRHLGRTAPPVPFRRLRKEPGMEMQVDYGTGAPVYDDRGCLRKTWLLCCTLSYSRRIYCEVHYRQDTQSFIRSIENVEGTPTYRKTVSKPALLVTP